MDLLAFVEMKVGKKVVYTLCILSSFEVGSSGIYLGTVLDVLQF